VPVPAAARLAKGDAKVARVQKLPFDAMQGLPPHDDAEVAALMEAVLRLPGNGADEVARCLLRAALARERTGDAEYLIRLGEDMLFTVRLQGSQGDGETPSACPVSGSDALREPARE
jgi:hypothetical protein